MYYNHVFVLSCRLPSLWMIRIILGLRDIVSRDVAEPNLQAGLASCDRRLMGQAECIVLELDFWYLNYLNIKNRDLTWFDQLGTNNHGNIHIYIHIYIYTYWKIIGLCFRYGGVPGTGKAKIIQIVSFLIGKPLWFGVPIYIKKQFFLGMAPMICNEFSTTTDPVNICALRLCSQPHQRASLGGSDIGRSCILFALLCWAFLQTPLKPYLPDPPVDWSMTVYSLLSMERTVSMRGMGQHKTDTKTTALNLAISSISSCPSRS